MKSYSKKHFCLQCDSTINESEFEYSLIHFNIPLCIRCQSWYKELNNLTTPETLNLYWALKERKVPAELEKYDGYKTIDIAVVDAKVNIEVDGGHHNLNPNQALSDLKRTYFSFLKGYLTLRIPNSLIRNHLDETADLITEFLIQNKNRNF